METLKALLARAQDSTNRCQRKVTACEQSLRALLVRLQPLDPSLSTWLVYESASLRRDVARALLSRSQGYFGFAREFDESPQARTYCQAVLEAEKQCELACREGHKLIQQLQKWAHEREVEARQLNLLEN